MAAAEEKRLNELEAQQSLLAKQVDALQQHLGVPAADAEEVDRLADVLDDDASDMDVFAQGSPRLSASHSSFAEDSKADDASSSLLESKDFQLYDKGDPHSVSDA